jgi:hypothetical protein
MVFMRTDGVNTPASSASMICRLPVAEPVFHRVSIRGF